MNLWQLVGHELKKTAKRASSAALRSVRDDLRDYAQILDWHAEALGEDNGKEKEKGSRPS